MYVSPAKCPLLHELYYRTPVQTSRLDTPECGMADSRAHTNRLIRSCTTVAMNSTVKDHQIGAESIGAMSCELSTINNSVLSFKRVTDTPAKVFARLKAKVQQLNPVEHRKESVVPVHPDRGVSLSKNILQPLDDDHAASEGQDTYVLTLSPPESTSKRSEDTQMPSLLDREPHNPVLGHKPVIVLEKTLTETFAQVKPQQNKSRMNSRNKSTAQEAAPRSVPNPMEDSLLQQSPRISIPRKQMSAVKSKHQIKEIDKALDGKTSVNLIHLRDWILKLHNKELIVDGIRLDNKIPWHSSCITERVSSNIVKTASGGTYVLVGKMSHYHSSSFPQWFKKKFLSGFPEMWKEYLNKLLMDNERSGKNRQRISSAPTKQKCPAKQLKSTPVGSSGSVQPHSAPVSRSGRLIKPPLEYWRGGRITVGPDMNVTVHEDYTSTSILLTPKTRPVVILKPLKLPTDLPMYKSPEMKDSSDEDTLAPRRRVKQHKSWRTVGTKSSGNASQKSSHDAVFNSDSGSEKATAKQPSPPKAQSEQMYLRKGRSYSRERTSNGSESEVTKFVASAEVGFSAVQAPLGKIKTRLNQKNLQKVIPSEKLSTSSSDSNTSSSQSQIRNIADQVFSPPDSTKRFRRKGSKHESKLVPPAATMSETEDDTLLRREIEVTKTRNTQRQKKAPKKNENYEMVDAGQESPHSEQKREDKNNSLKSTLKRMQQKQNSGVSERTKNGHIRQVDKHTEQSEKTDNLQPSVPGNTGKKPEPSVSSKTSRRNNKEQTAKHPSMEIDAIDGAWTDQELQKLNEAVNSLPKNKRGYWVNVSLVVGTRSAEECQKQYTTLYQNHRRSKEKRKAKTVKTNEPAKETAPITAKVGTLKRKKQMWEFLDHRPKDDHDDVFAGSPMRNKQIKQLPVWSTNGDEPDFGHLQNPQTPSSSMFSSVKTPQCLHITPGMLRSVNRDNNDKYIYHLQKVKRQDKNSRKSSPKQDKFTSVLSERKNKKRCVAEDDNFVVWNMLSDKDGPSLREEEEEEEDDYFMDEY
ncbi:mis18-binding protein 1 isoform X6 [Tachysurus fulvidraco]|uniref:mis18-binding protein 1 isoform X6 n=1 Tax=Tachysurus fulvidraco TaxID=1234273 RepID=UPI001FEDC2DC|nr:mis18-binding protein 1 isoform X6 [Tachysurus fulvidraco]